jgi:catechol 2,3-dioxygenase
MPPADQPAKLSAYRDKLRARSLSGESVTRPPGATIRPPQAMEGAGQVVSRIGHIDLRVADVDRAVEHAVTFMGRREVARDDGVAYLTCNERHHEFILSADVEAGVDHLGPEVASEADLAACRAWLAGVGLPIVDAPFDEQGIAASFWSIGPDGFVFKRFGGMAHDQPVRPSAPGMRPRRFGHIRLTSHDLTEMEDFLIGTRGFRLSDRAGTALSWLRCSDDHHGTALLADGENTLHHDAFELEGWASYHFFDTDGFVAEYMTELVRVDAETTYRWRSWPDLRVTINQYGPAAPPEFFAAGVGVARHCAQGAMEGWCHACLPGPSLVPALITVER